MSARFDHERIGGELGSDVFRADACCDELGEPGEHVKHGDGFTYLEKRMDFTPDSVDQFLDGAVAEGDDFVMGVFDLLVHFDQGQGLALDVFVLPVGVDEYFLQRSSGAKIGCQEAKVVLASRFVFEVDGDFLSFWEDVRDG